MRPSTHIVGLDILGAATNKAILIKVKNAGQLAQSQGAVASVAAMLVPATVEGQVYAEMRKQLAQNLADKNVDADVTIVDDASKYKPAQSNALVYGGIALGAAGILAAVLFASRGGRK